MTYVCAQYLIQSKHPSKTQVDKNEKIAFPESYSFGTNGDLYFTIHGFNYKKPSATSKTVIIEDYYDFQVDENHEYGFFMNAIVRTISLLEKLDLFTYYGIEITETLDLTPISSGEEKGYDEQKLVLLEKELKDFEQLNLQEISTGTYSGSAAPNNLYMVKFAPQETKNYNIKITTENKYYAYLICLTDATISSGSTSFRGPIIFENNLGNYVGGGTTKNLISMTLYNDCEYLLIICGNPAKTETFAFSYNLS